MSLEINIIVMGDTHLRACEPLPLEMMRAIKRADWVVHVGDYISPFLVSLLSNEKKNHFLGVHGNADPLSIRERLPPINELTIRRKKICFTHPVEGGDLKSTEKRVLFKLKKMNPDIILYGHTHEAKITTKNGILIVNPGKGYVEEGTFGEPTSYALLTIGTTIHAEIKYFHRK